MSWQDDPVVNSSQSSWQNDPVVDSPTILQTLGHAFVNNLPMGGNIAAGAESIPGIGTGKGYSENLENWNKQTPIDKAANPTTYKVGAVAGAVAPAFIAPETLAANPIVGNAVLGGLSAAGNTDVTKNPIGAVKQAALGAGIGGATAGILGKLMPTQSGLEETAGRKAIQSLDLPNVGTMTPEERQGLSGFIQENGLVGRDKTQVLEHARDLSKKFGEKIGEIGDKVENLGVTPEDHYQAMQGLMDKAKEYEGSKFVDGVRLARDYQKGADEILNLPANPTWNDIQALKMRTGKLAFDSKGEVKNQAIADTYFTLKDMLTKIAQKAQGSNLAPEYKQALAGYSQMQPIETALEKSVSSEFGGGAGMGVRGMMGMIRKLPGPARAVAGTAALATGHPILAGMAALPELTNPALQSKMATGMANVAGKLPAGTNPAVNQAIHDYLINLFQKKKGQ